MSSLRLEGKTAVVTGASRGIGLATANALAAAGANLAIFGRSEAINEKSEEIAARHGVAVAAFQVDAADSKAILDFYRQVFARFGGLDILVNNAGVLGDAVIGMISDKLIEDTFAVNLRAVILNMQAGAKLMRRGGGGSIVNIASIIGLRGNRGQVVYAASKAGVVGATLSAAKELAPYKIRVNAIAPGYIATDMIAHLPDAIHQERLASIPMGYAGPPEEVANAALFLASDLSTYITGQVLGVDGGMVI